MTNGVNVLPPTEVPPISYHRPRRARPTIVSPPANRIWLISFTDIMGLMLTFFILTYAMSEREVQKFDRFAAAFSPQKGSFKAAPLQMGDSDIVSLPRVHYRRGLDAAYLSQILERKKLDVPELQDLVLKTDSVDGMTLSMPLDHLVDLNRNLTTRTTRIVAREVAGFLAGTPNRFKVRIDWVGDRTQMAVALLRGRLVAREMQMAGLNNDITVIVRAAPTPSTLMPLQVHLIIDPFIEVMRK